MPSSSKLLARRKEFSGQVSTQTRGLALGFLAISWALLTAHDEPLRSMAANVNRYLILGLVVGSFLVLTCDLLQYVAATTMVNQAYQRAEASEDKTGEIDENSFAFKAQKVLYFTKFVILAVSSVLLVWIFVLLFLPSRVPPVAAQTPAPACIPVCQAAAPATTATPPAGSKPSSSHHRSKHHQHAHPSS